MAMETYYELNVLRTDGQGYDLSGGSDEPATTQEIDRWRVNLAKLMKIELAPATDSEYPTNLGIIWCSTDKRPS